MGLSLLLLFLVATLLFFSIHLLPGDPALLVLGGDSAQPTPEQIATVQARLGLDRPLPVQYVTWLVRVARGDMGTSLLDDRSVATDLANYAVLLRHMKRDAEAAALDARARAIREKHAAREREAKGEAGAHKP